MSAGSFTTGLPRTVWMPAFAVGAMATGGATQAVIKEAAASRPKTAMTPRDGRMSIEVKVVVLATGAVARPSGTICIVDPDGRREGLAGRLGSDVLPLPSDRL